MTFPQMGLQMTAGVAGGEFTTNDKQDLEGVFCIEGSLWRNPPVTR